MNFAAQRLTSLSGVEYKGKETIGRRYETLRSMWHGHCQSSRRSTKIMKRILATVLSLAIMSLAALPAAAQTRSRYRSPYQNRSVHQTRSVYNNNNYRYDRARRSDNYRNRDGRWVYEDGQWVWDDNRSVWERHRDKITTAAGAGGGAAIGGIVGGKKGAIIGAIAGGAGAALYTYKIRDKNRRY